LLNVITRNTVYARYEQDHNSGRPKAPASRMVLNFVATLPNRPALLRHSAYRRVSARAVPVVVAARPPAAARFMRTLQPRSARHAMEAARFNGAPSVRALQ